jgi:hypothetical protein
MDTVTLVERRLYRHIAVWERLSEAQLACYQCLEVIPLGKFCVQSKDFYSLPLDRATHANLVSQFLTLLSEEPPDERVSLHESLEEAIQAHNLYFS